MTVITISIVLIPKCLEHCVLYAVDVNGLLQVYQSSMHKSYYRSLMPESQNLHTKNTNGDKKLEQERIVRFERKNIFELILNYIINYIIIITPVEKGKQYL